MSRILLNTSTASYAELISNSKTYKVPLFQRDYSWEEDDWEDLWYDMLVLKEEETHYMGYVVLQEQGDKNYLIIDGQQRFATLSCLALATVKTLDDWASEGNETELNRQRKEKLIERFLGNKPASSLKLTSKLFLNKNNDDFYQSYLLQLRKPVNVGRLKISEKILWKCFCYYYDKIKAHFEENKNGGQLARFLEEEISENLVFTKIEVSDDLNAYKVFETLNARGVKLSASDLLKNYIFSVVAKSSETDLTQAERQWQNIVNQLQTSEFSDLLRHFWNSRYPLERKRTLFKTVKKTITKPEDAFNLLNDLEDAAPLYTALSNPADAIWTTKDQRKYITVKSARQGIYSMN